MGVGWNFAPVLDVHTNPANPVIGNRAFGTHARGRRARRRWRSGAGCGRAGVVGCGKHYPGHGDTRTDSHHELPVVAHDVDRLRAVELAPFAAAAAAGMEAFMTAHVLYPALDPDRPATLSRRIATDLLRGELGFRGVLVSDDLGMKAVADRYPIEELAVGAIEAGCDHLLVREPVARQHAAFEAIVHAAEARSDMRARVEESAARVARAQGRLHRRRCPRPPRCCRRCSAPPPTRRWPARSPWSIPRRPSRSRPSRIDPRPLSPRAGEG